MIRLPSEEDDATDLQRTDDHFEDEDELEAASLMTSSTNEDDGEMEGARALRVLVCLMICALVVATLALFLPGMFSKSDQFESLRTPARIPVTFQCPEVIQEAENFDPSFEKDYVNVTKQITDNMTEFLETFREADYDDWGRSYETVKDGMFHWKSSRYPDYLKDGDSIFESACGIGLNLFMTLEILQEVKGIENLFVYGNEYVEVSAAKADAVMSNVAPAHGQKGVICPGDSANLYFVPSDAFDLVFTGYISPVLDPLHFGKSTNENYDRYTMICKSEDDDWKGKKLNQMAQDAQDDWYGRWIAEMARIAKPGVPVIVEQVSPPYCNAEFDWGGVSQDWFRDSAVNNTYNW
eukprot:CAMPEP_0117048074 /NCGR_PEP_ID=MMETSP0472-20121206/33220_1 /TAXON_ID=693140 ORGANISM="Tiarina fusus, Strain LIS" /NCGR_SAMPLE_ID=MMETSP0472 /ASSEMBLY_ACC=CAM_ASM_000603 /LENGTH=351 /DNA_ID=CAMNT_0004761011 /DNA_START=59 /DNA_END=1111 /DNA_ORIENTATION=+